MSTLHLPNEKLSEILRALKHSASSPHQPHCGVPRMMMYCSCHVGEAEAAYKTLCLAVKYRRVSARELKVGQWLMSEVHPSQRIVTVNRGAELCGKIVVSVDYGSTESRSVAETRSFNKDDMVLILDPDGAVPE